MHPSCPLTCYKHQAILLLVDHHRGKPNQSINQLTSIVLDEKLLFSSLLFSSLLFSSLLFSSLLFSSLLFSSLLFSSLLFSSLWMYCENASGNMCVCVCVCVCVSWRVTQLGMPMLDIRASHGDLSFKGQWTLCMSELMETILRAFTENERVSGLEYLSCSVWSWTNADYIGGGKSHFQIFHIFHQYKQAPIQVFFSFDCHWCFGNIAIDVQANNSLWNWKLREWDCFFSNRCFFWYIWAEQIYELYCGPTLF